MDWIDTVIGLVAGGGLVTIATLPSVIKKAKKEANAPEIEAWKSLADERQEQNKELSERVAQNEQRIDALNSRIDELYRTINEWRDKYNEQAATNTRLQAEIERDKPKLCVVRGCANREPKSDY